MRLFLLSLSLMLFGCSDDFAPYSNLSSLRILAMRSEPAMPQVGQPATIQALVYAPDDQAITYRWSYCPFGAKAKDNYVCPLSYEQAVAIVGPTIPAFDLGSDARATFQHDLTPATLSELCKRGVAVGGFAGNLDCDLGFPMTIVLDASTVAGNLRGAFQVYLPVDELAVPNSNPAIEAILADSISLDFNSLSATPEQNVSFTVAAATGSAEIRPIPEFEGGPGTRLERLSFSWFSDAGSWDADRTSYIEGATTLMSATTNTWTAPLADRFGKATNFFIVVRDDRGGVGWIDRRLLLEVRL